ncbi:hypothetical protein TSUD_287290 [Trifolium subterraneum]|uniref:Uncharacterized protein n=1 Tax=Trifolium subterraneum TaxID=3900 RepID=A0A2Z6PQR4_TRISU|nr:hypothetical protein TSUD_287290 [Trifolium subterraneum]
MFSSTEKGCCSVTAAEERVLRSTGSMNSERLKENKEDRDEAVTKDLESIMAEDRVEALTKDLESSVEAVREILAGPYKTSVAVTRLSFQNFGEVDPNFHVENPKLTKDWLVMNQSGGYHKLIYNRCYSFPLIVGGWDELKKFEGFPDNVEVLFAYYGGKLYSIMGFREITCLSSVMPYHSRSIFPRIEDDFADYVKLGHTWYHVCVMNNFKGGDVVRFKFGPGFRCNLYKIPEA